MGSYSKVLLAFGELPRIFMIVNYSLFLNYGCGHFLSKTSSATPLINHSFASELQKPIVYLPALKIYKERKSYQVNKAIKIIQNSKH